MAFGQRDGSFNRYREYFMKLSLAYSHQPDIRMFLELALTLATVSFFLVFVLRPTALTITQLLKDVDSKKDIISQMDTKIGNLTIAQDVLARESTRISLLDNAMPDRPLADILISQIETLSQKNNLTIVNFVVNKMTILGNMTRDNPISDLPTETNGLDYSLNVKSTKYSDLISFLSGLELMGRPSSFDLVSFTSNITATESYKSLTVNAKVPFLITNITKQ